ncbi:caspase, EACC1-associated type [Streptomyces pseudovenezuelae]|uniref:caspase, EACC1-associated type n=1 Tax=Streptomyces pseudovenezuelae TaxID=67350 RepID=UPI0036EC5708
MTEQQTRGSRAVLLGVHTFTHFPYLEGVSRNIPALLAQLTDPEVGNLPKENCAVLPAQSERGRVLDAVCQAAEEADDLLLVYYAGHGHFDRGGGLLLATEASSITRRHHSVPYEAIREYVEVSRARHKVVIVDCCYSGLALRMGEASTEATDRLAIEGACVLTSAAETQQSLCLAEGSLFTLALVDVLRDGLTGLLPDGRQGNEQSHLRTADVFEGIRARLAGRIVDDLPVPEPRIATRGDGHKIPLARNRAFTKPPAPPRAPLKNLSGQPAPNPLAVVVDQQTFVDGLAGYRKSLTPEYLPFVSPGPSHPSEPHRLFCRLRDHDDRGVLLVGAAGAGKTRTTMEVGWIALREGWRVFHVIPELGSSLTIRLTAAILAESSPVLIVIDYLNEVLNDEEDNGASLDLTALHHLLLPEARRMNIQVALLASVRLGWLRKGLHVQLHDLFDEVELRQDEDFQRVVADHAVTSMAPTLVARLGMERSRELVGHRPTIAVLMARELEYRAVQGLPITDTTGLRAGSALWSWVRGALEADDLPVDASRTTAFDEVVSPDWLMPAAAAVAACPQEKADVIAAANAALARTSSRLQCADDLVNTLIDLGWLVYEESSGLLNTVHDVVCDQLVESVLLSARGRTANRERTHALLTGCLTSPGTVSRYTTNLARLLNDLALDNRAEGVSAVIEEWVADNAHALGDVLRRDADAGGYALEVISSGPPWSNAAVHNWQEVVGPWLEEFGGHGNAYHVLRWGLSDLPSDGALLLVPVALRWVETYGWRREASHVLGPLLRRSDHAVEVQELVLRKAMGWLRRNGELLEAGFVLSSLVDRTNLTDDQTRRAVAHALGWLQRHESVWVAHMVLRPLLSRGNLTEEETRRAASLALSWLEAHASEPPATYVLCPLLAQPEADENQTRQAIAFAFRWLDDHAATAEAHFILRALLERPGLTDHAVRRAASFADQWLEHHSATEEAGFLMRRLTERLDMTDDETTRHRP